MIGGIIVGVLFGFVLQSGRFCMNSAFRDILLLKEFKLAKAVVIAIVVEMVGFGIFAAAGVITLSPKPFNVGGSIVGGLVFGIGMVLAAGCASGTTYRVGEGMMGSLVAAFGLTSGALATAGGLFTEAKNAIQSVTVGTQLTVFGEYDAVLTPVLMIIVGLVLAVVIFFFWGLPGFKKKREADGPLIKTDDVVTQVFKKGYPYWVAGITVGIVCIVGYVVSAGSDGVLGGGGVLGITGGWMSLSKYLTLNTAVTWAGFIIMGLVLGSFISALIAGEFKLRIPKDGKTLLIQLIGGVLMGFGAVTAAGCNITNVLGGVPQLSIHSIMVGVFILLGCWIMTYLLFMRKED
jgi:uncharacterized membrane protein YedE/YeeE